MSEPKRITSGPFAGDTRHDEPYMGVVKVSRCSGRADLFGSDVEHQHFIELEVCHADMQRHLSDNWIHSGKQIVSVWMSEIQWAHLLSSLNQGEGSPVTIKHIQGQRIAPPAPPKGEASTFQAEIVETVQDSVAALRAAVTRLQAATVPKAKVPGKTELGEILASLTTALREFENNVPFVEKQFGEHIEAKMAEAKCEFEGFMQNRLRQMGLEAAALTQAKEEAPNPGFTSKALPQG